MTQSWSWSSLEETRKSSGKPCWNSVSRKTVDVLRPGMANPSVKCELIAASSVMEVPQTIENEWLWPGSNTAFILYINISNQYDFICHEVLFFLLCFSSWNLGWCQTHVFYRNQAGLWFASLCSKPFWLGRAVVHLKVIGTTTQHGDSFMTSTRKQSIGH